MTLRLVSEARPIKWTQLSTIEKKLLEDADHWIRDVIQDGKAKRPSPKAIERDRTGRVLLIDGQRGAGKTSFLLTLLDRWKEQKTESRVGAKIEGVEVILPILDFDPLPHGMPLHGWLLEPWRKLAKEYEKQGTHGSKDKDLSELWNEVFERAVIGWTSAATPGKGVVERAIQYQEQASGWIDTREVWHNLVNAMVCTSLRCSDDPKKCEKELHPVVFVIAIDDVDLQVEHLPQLLHAIRLLHHPNVAYVLTGDRIHLELALELDYLARHARCAGAWSVQKNDHEDLRQRITTASTQLRCAFLEKALPEHATLHLPTLDVSAVLDLPVRNAQEEKHHVKDYLTATLTALSKEFQGTPADRLVAALKVLSEQPEQNTDPHELFALPVATARQTQHAIDRRLVHAPMGDANACVEFVADLCGTNIERRKDEIVRRSGKPRFMLRGQLTNRLGEIRRSWEADQIKVVLADPPKFAFLPEWDETRVQSDEKAHGAVLIQLAVEAELAEAFALDWVPEVDIATTEVSWNPKSRRVGPTAIFYWPWLKRPTVSQILDLGRLSRKMSSEAPDTSLAAITEQMVETWLVNTIDWFDPSIKNGEGTLESCLVRLNKRTNVDEKKEIARWVRQVFVMTAPYYGLPDAVKASLQEVLKKNFPRVLTAKEVKEQEVDMVKNAVIATRRLKPGQPSLSDQEHTTLTDRFLEQREATKWIETDLRLTRARSARKAAASGSSPPAKGGISNGPPSKG